MLDGNKKNNKSIAVKEKAYSYKEDETTLSVPELNY